MAQNRTRNILDQLLQSRERARERAAANPAFPFQEDLRNIEADLQSQQALEGMEANQAQRLELAQAPATIGGAEAPGETTGQVLEREFDYTGQAAAYDREFTPGSEPYVAAEQARLGLLGQEAGLAKTEAATAFTQAKTTAIGEGADFTGKRPRPAKTTEADIHMEMWNIFKARNPDDPAKAVEEYQTFAGKYKPEVPAVAWSSKVVLASMKDIDIFGTKQKYTPEDMVMLAELYRSAGGAKAAEKALREETDGGAAGGPKTVEEAFAALEAIAAEGEDEDQWERAKAAYESFSKEIQDEFTKKYKSITDWLKGQ